MDDWYFSKEDMLIFAKRYAKTKLEEAAERVEERIKSYESQKENLTNKDYSTIPLAEDAAYTVRIIRYKLNEARYIKQSITETPLD